MAFCESGKQIQKHSHRKEHNAGHEYWNPHVLSNRQVDPNAAGRGLDAGRIEIRTWML